MFSAIHHVAIICADIETSKRFYLDTLGFTLIAEQFRADRNSWKVDIACGNAIQLELFTFPDAPPRPSYPEAAGLRHLAFAAKNLRHVHQQLHHAGVAVQELRVDDATGKEFFFFADPDGLPLEVYEE